MKNIVFFARWMIGKYIKKEVRSVAGRMNLFGGVMAFLLLSGVFISSIPIQLINTMLSMNGKAQLPSLGGDVFVVSFCALLIYFMQCISNLR